MMKRTGIWMVLYMAAALWATILMPAFAAAPEGGPMVLRDDRADPEVNAHVTVLRDEGGAFAAEELLPSAAAARFTPIDGVPSFGYTSAVYWARLEVRNETAQTAWRLTVHYPPLDRIDLYVNRGQAGYLHKQAGDLLPFDAREVRSRNFVFSLTLAEGETTTLLLRFQSEGAVTFPLTLRAEPLYSEQEQHTSLLLGVYYGLMLALTLYNAVLALSFRSREMLYYVLAGVATLLLYLTFNGSAFQYLWPEAVWWNNRAIVFFMCAVHIAALQFAWHFLQLSRYAPKLRRLFGLYIGLEAANIAVLLISYPAGLYMTGPLLVAIELTVLAAGVVSWQRGFRGAAFFLAGWGASIAGALLSFFADAGWIPASAFTANASQLASAFEAVILSWAMAHRIHRMRREKERAELLMAETQRLAQSDPLTGLFNRRYLEEQFRDAAQRKETPLALLMLDIDHFKQVNDSYGHQAGDAVLRQVAALLQREAVPGMVAARYGGEEFILLLRSAKDGEASELARRLNRLIGNETFDVGEHRIECTVSIGIGVWNEAQDEDFEQTLRRADRALYEAKRSGRNRVCGASSA